MKTLTVDDQKRVRIPNAKPRQAPERALDGYLVVSCRIKYFYTLEQAPAGGYVANCLSLPGCIGREVDERSAIAKMVAALRINLEKEAEFGKPLQVRMERCHISEVC